VVADLRAAANVPSESYDCIVLTQTLHLLDDVPRALAECERLLRPGGVLLATLPCASRVCLEYGREGDHWRVTEAGARGLFSAVFAEEALELRCYGSVLTHAAFLYGLACHELDPAELDAVDPYFPLLIGVRAAKPLRARAVSVPEHPRARSAPTRDARRAAILLYHRVAEARCDPHALCVSPVRFREQMLRLREAAEPVGLGELARRLFAGEPLGGGVAVTFDDGTLDHLDTASPILLELGIPGTFFVTTDGLDGPHGFWWDSLAHALLEGDVPARLELELAGVRKRFATRSPAERRIAHDALHGALVGLGADERDALVAAVARWSGGRAPADARARALLADEIRALAARPGHEIGAHGAQHLWLARQPRNVQLREVESSADALAALLGHPPRAFAYPFGAHAPETVEIARARFEIALTRDAGLVAPGADPWRLPRFEVGDWPGEHFAANLARWLAGVGTPTA
jgi:peptidoglycan/xylan/chitin deacetylase (PgdA/CDA1 family)